MCIVLQVMDLMELSSLKGSLVGLPGHSGLSVEQRKRLTIGVELVANPSIVFMVSLRSSNTRWSCFLLPLMTCAVRILNAGMHQICRQVATPSNCSLCRE